MNLRRYKNLVPDSALHRELEKLLQEQNGRVSLQQVCEQVMQIRGQDGQTAEKLVAALIEGDPRMRLNGNATVEWTEPSPEEISDPNQRFTVFDLEVTNAAHGQERIIEIGICHVEKGEIVDELSSLVNPERPIPYWVRRLTGIKNEDVRRAPRFKELLPRLLDELEDALLVAHHARFDVDCLNSEISRVLEQRLTNRYLCTVELSRRFLPGSESYRLESLSQWLQLSHERPHRAGSDARATAELFCHLLRKAEASWSDYLRPRPTPAAKEERAQTAETD